MHIITEILWHYCKYCILLLCGSIKGRLINDDSYDIIYETVKINPLTTSPRNPLCCSPKHTKPSPR